MSKLDGEINLSDFKAASWREGCRVAESSCKHGVSMYLSMKHACGTGIFQVMLASLRSLIPKDSSPGPTVNLSTRERDRERERERAVLVC